MVADNRIDRGRGYNDPYILDTGEVITRLELSWLKKREWVELPMAGPPRITADGRKHLRDQA